MTDGRLERGDYVRVRLNDNDEWCDAFVALAGGSSVALLLKGAVRTSDGGRILNFLPLTIDYAAQTITGLNGDSYQIEVAP